MKREAHDYLAKLPAKIGAGAGTAITAWSAGDPSGFQRWWGWAVSPDHIRIGGAIGLALCVAYWVALIVLKPSPKEEKPTATGPTANGDRANAVGSNQTIGHQGDNHHYYAPPRTGKPVVDARFENVIKLSPASQIEIGTRGNGPAARQFAGQVGVILVRNQWKARDFGVWMDRPFDGVNFCGNRSSLSSTDAKTLEAAFQAIGIQIAYDVIEPGMDGFIRIDVGEL